MADKEIFTVADGKELIQFARDNIEFYLKHNKSISVPEVLKEKYKENLLDKFPDLVEDISKILEVILP